ncbi:alpha-N-acetylgalactosaminide alpha-2,6-sialyltransferase 2-like [Patiria miniata]|uniref:alpha-N-acetylgalactosaminide alpha-2,6-sialyltransferase n=1 Tax=Patiria miniata TaxID=46514 RepID=A0A914BAP8_PATMI|nr:alpha-N-acetylgalactosaminide alpha-2,6-sialyltransferase 2-like [Patiria miniata]
MEAGVDRGIEVSSKKAIGLNRVPVSTMSRRHRVSWSLITRSIPFIPRCNHRFMIRLITAYIAFFVTLMYLIASSVVVKSTATHHQLYAGKSVFVKSTATRHIHTGNRSMTTRGPNCTGWTCNQAVTPTPPTNHSLQPWAADNYTNRFFWETFLESGEFVTFKGGEGQELEFRKNPGYVPSKCPTSIQRRMSNNRRGRTIFHPEIHLLMNSKLLNESEFKRLGPYYMPFGYKYRKDQLRYKDYLAALKIFPPKTSIFAFSNDHPRPECLSCAVVGNGGILKGSRKGAEIDSHHMVFRVNKAIRRNHERDVGNRTTHYIFYDRSLRKTNATDVPNDKGLIYVFVPCRDNDYKYITSVVRGKEPKLKAAAQDVRILHPDFIRYINKIWVNSPQKSYRPTTGGIMLMAAFHFGCDQVSVYGMGYNVKYSLYYTDTVFRRISMKIEKGRNTAHDIHSELAILKGLDRAGIISWYKRDVKEFFTTGSNS